MKRSTSRRKRLLFTLVALGLTAGIVEGLSFLALLVIAQQPNVIRSETHLFDAHRNHRLNPAFQLSDLPHDKIHSPDSLRRGDAVKLEKPPRTVRVVVLGTSALYGIGSRSPYPARPPLANDETVTHFLEQLIRDRLRDEGLDWNVEILNAGVSAYHTFHHLVYLNANLLAYRPDVVVNLDGHNDFYARALEDRWNEYAYSTSILVDQYNGRTFYLSALTGTRALAPYSYFFNLLERVFRRSWYRKVDQPLRHTPRLAFPGAADFREIARQTYIRDLWQIHQLGEYANFRHCVFLQPEILLEDEQSLGEVDRNLRQITRQHTPANRAEQMQEIRSQLPALFQEAEIPFYDIGELAPSNAAGVQLYVDYCHLTPAGAELTAQHMLEVVYGMVRAEVDRAEDHETKR